MPHHRPYPTEVARKPEERTGRAACSRLRLASLPAPSLYFTFRAIDASSFLIPRSSEMTSRIWLVMLGCVVAGAGLNISNAAISATTSSTFRVSGFGCFMAAAYTANERVRPADQSSVAHSSSADTVPNVTASASQVIKAATAYFAIVFVAGFALGTLRTLVVAPHFGDLAAVALELPVMLAISWIVCGRVVARLQLPPQPLPRGAMGAIAFGLLMLAELTLAVGLFGRSLSEYAAHFTTPHGLLGLAGQILFGLIPLARRNRRL